MDQENLNALSLKELAERADVYREQKRTASRQEKDASAALETVMGVIQQKMDEQGTDKISANGVTFTLSETTLPSVKDWEAVHAYIKEHDCMHLLEKRMSSVAYRELLAVEGSVPGVEPFVKRTVGMRKS